LRREGGARVVTVAGLPMHHWTVGDRVAEAYAMVSLMLCGYADQHEVARAFGCSSRTVRRHQRRYEHAGISALGRAPCRPAGIQAKPSPWVHAAAALSRTGASVRDIAQRLKVSKSVVSKWLRRLGWKSQEAQVRDTVSEGARAQRTAVLRSDSITDHGRGGSLDPDPSKRVLDRLFARLGLVMDAEPVFIPGQRVPRAGVLLAVPALVHSGIFEVAEEVYGHIGPAFYGLRTTMLALLLLALLRLKRPEALKEHAPADLGRMLGLDRAPEVKTLRRKLGRLAGLGHAEVFGRKLAQRRVARRGRAVGFLYVDGHVRVYHGQRRIGKAHVTRLRLSLPATTDFWVNDKTGEPVFVLTAEVTPHLVAMLPKILARVRRLVGRHRRVTVIFDRGGWSPKLFARLLRAGFDILTYRKGRCPKTPRSKFQVHTKRLEGRRVSYALHDRHIRLLNGRLRLRQITRLGTEGHQTPIVTSRFDLPAVELAYRMFERWRQENFFKYLKEEYALDALADYETEAEDPARSVPNPERRALEKKLARARAELRKLQALYGEAAIGNPEGKRPTVRGFKIAHGKLGRRIREIAARMEALAARRDHVAQRIAVREVTGEPVVRLSRERKHLTNCIKMVAFQAESDLLALLRPAYARADQEGRTLVTTALQSAADIEVGRHELRVILAPLSSPHRTRAIATLCEALNRMEACFPGTQLRMRFGVAS